MTTYAVRLAAENNQDNDAPVSSDDEVEDVNDMEAMRKLQDAPSLIRMFATRAEQVKAKKLVLSNWQDSSGRSTPPKPNTFTHVTFPPPTH